MNPGEKASACSRVCERTLVCVCCARALSPVWDPRLPRASRRALSSFVSCLIIIIINTVFPSVAPPCRASPTRGGECAPCVRGVRPGEDALHDTRFPPAGRIFWSLSFVSVSACVCSRELCRVRCESVRLTCRLRRFESVGGTELSAFRALAFFFFICITATVCWCFPLRECQAGHLNLFVCFYLTKCPSLIERRKKSRNCMGVAVLRDDLAKTCPSSTLSFFSRAYRFRWCDNVYTFHCWGAFFTP